MNTSDAREPALAAASKPEFNAAEIGALAHLYRGEVYRSTVWRTRLDSSTNWAVVTTGIALSATYSSAGASPLQNGTVGGLSPASRTRTTPGSTLRICHECVPSRRGPRRSSISAATSAVE